MKHLKATLFIGWVANSTICAFAPSVTSIRTVSSIASLGARLERKEDSLNESKFCIPLEEICLNDLPKVGGKTASLGEMIQQVSEKVILTR